MVEIGTIEATLKLNSSEFTAGIEGAESSLKEFAGSAEQAAGQVSTSSTKMGNDATTASDKTASGMEGATGRVTTSAAATGGSMRTLALGFSQTATSAFALYQSFDNIEKRQYAVEKANLAVDKSEVSLKKAQDEYNAALDEYGPTSAEAEAAAIKLQIATDANDLANERARLSQNSLNDSMTMAGLTIIPSVISGIDGMFKMWKNFQGLDVIGRLQGITTSLGSNKTALVSWGAGLAAIGFIFAAFTTKSEDTRIMLSLLAGGLIAVAAAQWIWNAAAAFGIGLTGVGLALVAVAVGAAALVYGLSATYGSSTSGEVAASTQSNVSAINSGVASRNAEATSTVEPMGQATSTTMFRDKDGNARSREWLSANPSMIRYPLMDIDGNSYDWPSYLALDDNMRRYAQGGWAMTPQIAMLAENEPELIIPASKMGNMGGSGGNTYNFHIDGSRDVDLVMNEIARRLRETGGTFL
jgi:hypothetical protein